MFSKTAYPMTLLAICCLLEIARADGQTVRLLNDMESVLQRVDSLLASFPDKYSRTTSVNELNESGSSYQRLSTELLERMKTAGDEEKTTIERGIDRSRTAQYAMAKKHYLRLSRDQVIGQLNGVFPFAQFNSSSRRIARAEIELIDHYIHAFHNHFDRFPKELGELTTTQVFLLRVLRKEEIVDPWGKPYKYDMQGKMNKGSKPDVWTAGPIGSAEKEAIGNWQARR
jgi:hypothetical protein